MGKGSKLINIYTDGAANSVRHNGNRRGGWAAIFVGADGKKLWHMCGGHTDTTNNRMELTAVIEALQYAGTLFDKIIIYSDSQYVVKGFNEWIYAWIENDWKNDKIKNKDLWEELIPFVGKDNIDFVWIRGHNKNKWNEEADKIARRAR